RSQRPLPPKVVSPVSVTLVSAVVCAAPLLMIHPALPTPAHCTEPCSAPRLKRMTSNVQPLTCVPLVALLPSALQTPARTGPGVIVVSELLPIEPVTTSTPLRRSVRPG